MLPKWLDSPMEGTTVGLWNLDIQIEAQMSKANWALNAIENELHYKISKVILKMLLNDTEKWTSFNQHMQFNDFRKGNPKHDP
jgi:hypothetical protein